MKVNVTKKVKAIAFIVIAVIALALGLYLECCDKKEFVISSVPKQMQAQKSGNENKSHYDDEGRLDINLATVEELMKLTGIGEVIASRIVNYREENGQFMAVEELTLIPGIGYKILDNNREYICVR